MCICMLLITCDRQWSYRVKGWRSTVLRDCSCFCFLFDLHNALHSTQGSFTYKTHFIQRVNMVIWRHLVLRLQSRSLTLVHTCEMKFTGGMSSKKADFMPRFLYFLNCYFQDQWWAFKLKIFPEFPPLVLTLMPNSECIKIPSNWLCCTGIKNK